jgi:hypothetical protein
MKATQKLFAVLSLMILAFGFLPLFAQPLPYEGQDWLTYEATMYYGDSYEPDDSRTLARQCIVNSSIQFHNFHVKGDPDWIWFYAQIGWSYTIKADARTEGSLADTVLELYDRSGRLVTSDDDGGDMTDSILQFQATYTGIYYVSVTEWAQRYGNDYWYHLSVVTP